VAAGTPPPRHPSWLARDADAGDRGPRPQRDLGDPPPRGDDPRHFAHEPLQEARRRAHPGGELRRHGARCARRDRRRGHPRRGGEAVEGGPPGRGGAEDDRQRPLGDRHDVRLRHRRLDRDRGDRPAPLHRGVARPRHRVRGHGAPRRLDRAPRGDGRGGRSHPGAGAAGGPRRGVRVDPAAPRGGEDVLDRRRRRARRSPGGGGDQGRREGRVRARPPRRDRGAPRFGDREGDRVRDPVCRPRPRAAGRHADRVRPLARDALRPPRRRHGPRGALRDDGRLPGRRLRCGPAGGGRRLAEDRSRGGPDLAATLYA